MLADELDYVLGVDTHRDEHVMAVVTAPAGAVVAAAAAPANARGYRELLRVAERTRLAAAPGRSRAPAATAPVSPATSTDAARACSRSVARHAAERRLRGKDDALDAAGTARAALAAHTLALAARRRAARGAAALARRAPQRRRRPPRSADAAARRHRHRAGARSANSCAGCRTGSCSTAAAACAARSAGSRRARDPARAAQPRPPHRSRDRSRPTSSSATLLVHVRALAPTLLDEPGVGPIVAAQLLVAWSHRGRSAPKPPSPASPASPRSPPPAARHTRHRLSRGGDRQLNRALHTIVLHRRQHDPATRDYIARRIAEGKTRRDATRLLKRYLARHLYRLLNQEPLMA